MYIDIKKVLKLAEDVLPKQKEDIQNIQKNIYYPFMYQGYLFKYEFGVCQWEAVKEAFQQPMDIRLEQDIAYKTTKIIEAFFKHLLPDDY